jgi:hypothetical protein
MDGSFCPLLLADTRCSFLEVMRDLPLRFCEYGFLGRGNVLADMTREEGSTSQSLEKLLSSLDVSESSSLEELLLLEDEVDNDEDEEESSLQLSPEELLSIESWCCDCVAS